MRFAKNLQQWLGLSIFYDRPLISSFEVSPELRLRLLGDVLATCRDVLKLYVIINIVR